MKLQIFESSMRLILLLCLGMGIACQSQTHVQQLSALKPAELSFASLARDRLESSCARLLLSIEDFLREPVETQDALRNASEQWRETLALFVHVFPSGEAEDPYRKLLGDAEEGLRLFERDADREEIRKWSEKLASTLTSPEFLSYRSRLQDRYAARRKAAHMPKFYWTKVNFIPALDGSAELNHRDYFHEQCKTLKKEKTRALRFDPLSGFAREALEEVRMRASLIVGLDADYAIGKGSEALLSEVRETEEFSGNMIDELRRYERHVADGDEAGTESLGRAIARRWEEERGKAVKPSVSALESHTQTKDQDT